jgi:dTDP-glucose 4,6-dehydratase
MKYIITGVYGFIGSEFLKRVYRENEFSEIIVVDSVTYAADKSRIPIQILRDQRVTFLEMDICDLTYDMVGDFEYLVNFAAETHVDNSIENGLPFMQTNVQGVYNLLEVSRKSKTLKKFVQISTDEVYGDVKDKFCSNEKDILNPSSYYSSSKASADLLVQSAHRTYGIPYLITRSCNNFGGLQNSEKFIPKVIECIKSNKPIPVYGDGNQLRVWISVEENADVIFRLTTYDDCVNEIINVGSEHQRTNNEIVKMISTNLFREPTIHYVQDRLGHDEEYNLDLCKLKSLEFELDMCVDEFQSPEDYFEENL